jgi:hypothetical protein
MKSVFVPTRVTPAGPRHLAVTRSGRSRVVAFENFDMAQRAVDVLSSGEDLIHVVTDLLTQPLYAGDQPDGVMIVQETDPDSLEGFRDVDLCEFLEPNFVDLVDTIEVRDGADERALLEALFERS